MPSPAFVHETYKPHPALRPYIYGYSVFRSVLPDEDCTRITSPVRPASRGFFDPGDPLIDTTIPSAHVMFMFSFGAPMRVRFGDSTRYTSLSSCIFGPVTKSGKMDMTSQANFFGVAFRTGAADKFLNLPVHKLTDQLISMEDFWGVSGRALERGLCSCGSVHEQIRRLEEELLHRLPAAQALDARFQFLLTHIARHQGAASVQWFSDSAGLSRQHLARKFREAVGVSPKFYCRTLRFHALLEKVYSATKSDWATLAADFGYYDQAHLIAEFKEFTGSTPGEFIAPH